MYAAKRYTGILNYNAQEKQICEKTLKMKNTSVSAS